MRPLTIADMMIRELITVQPDDTLATLRDRMYENNIRHIPVVDRRRGLVGSVSHRDLLRPTLMERPHISSSATDGSCAVILRKASTS